MFPKKNSVSGIFTFFLEKSELSHSTVLSPNKLYKKAVSNSSQTDKLNRLAHSSVHLHKIHNSQSHSTESQTDLHRTNSIQITSQHRLEVLFCRTNPIR